MIIETKNKSISYGSMGLSFLYVIFITINSQEPLVAAFLGDKVLAIMEKRNQVYKPRKVLSQ